jgi:hypothetical protein
MNKKSELMVGGEAVPVDEGSCRLHMRNSGMNRMRAREKVRSRFADHTNSRGKEQTYLPAKSPTLNTRKCTALNKRGCVSGLVGWIDVVIAGKTA